MILKTKKEMIVYLNGLINRLILLDRLKGYPFTRDLKYMKKEWLIKAIKIYEDMLK